MKKKFNIIKLVPPGLDFEQTVELARLAKKQGLIYVSACAMRFSPGFQRLRECLESEDIETFHLITAVSNTPEQTGQTHDRWLSDPQLAGGGALLRDCYEIIDQIVLTFGIPQQVYSLNTNHAPDKQQRLSITEDSAVVTMKFSDTLMGNIITSRTLGPQQQFLRLHSREKYLTVSKDRITVCDNQDNVIDESKYTVGKTESMEKMLENFAMSVLAPDKNKLFADVGADLNDMAVIESAYLSAKTAMPEEPSRILNMANIEPTTIWTSTPKRIV